MLASLLPKFADRAFLTEFRVLADSLLIGKGNREAGFTPERGVTVVSVIRAAARSRSWLLGPLAAGDRVVVHSSAGQVLALREDSRVALDNAGGDDPIIMAGVLGPLSRPVGQRVARVNQRHRHGTTILTVHTRGEKIARASSRE